VIGTAVHIPTLETERLVLRALRREDFAAYARTLASPRAGWIGHRTRRQAWMEFCGDVAGWQLLGFGHWAVDRADGAHLGVVGFQHPPHFPEPEIGWMLHAGHEGHGYAFEAARAALDWAQGRLAPLVSYVTPGNHRSEALARRLGAAPDPDAPLPDGETRDETTVWRHWGPA
jgi:RimJ/RimL family protein N-acetyltransferase